MELKSLSLRKQACPIDQLFRVPGKLRAVIAISAYVDHTSIEELVDFVSGYADERGKPILRIFIDRASSRFYSDRMTYSLLLKANSRIIKLCAEGSGIFLVRAGSLFHSKAYLIDGNTRSRLILGSMNMTQNGLSLNEELLLSIDMQIAGKGAANALARSIRGYADDLEKNSKKVQKGEAPRFATSLRQMLLDGYSCYEQKEQTPFRFKLHLPEQAIGLVQATGIDPWLDANMVDSLALEQIIEADPHQGGLGRKLPEQPKEKSIWKRLCVETCYGFWTPQCLKDQFEQAREARMKLREPRFDSILEIIDKEEGKILEAFTGFCSRVKQVLKDRKINGWRYNNPADAKTAWKRWIDNVRQKVGNEEYRRRLLSGLDTAACPDVWGDPISTEEMESSFCRSIIYCWSKNARGTSNRVAKAIAENLEFDDAKRRDTAWEDLREAMVRWMCKNPEKDIAQLPRDHEL